MDLELLRAIFVQTGPAGLVATVFAAVWWFERREVKQLQRTVIKLSAIILASRERNRD